MHKTIALIARHHTAGIETVLQELVEFLLAQGHQLFFEADTAMHIKREGVLAQVAPMSVTEIGLNADLAIVLGGDGTMLGIARQLAPFDIPLIGVNQGRLGFMTDISRDRMIPAVTAILSGNYKSERRSMLEGRVIRNGAPIFFGLAVNDVVVARGSGAGMVELRVDVDDHFMYNQRSDGLILATPTGSTAYSLSAGGPLMHPSLRGIVLVPIAPHALSNRPIVVPETSEILIEVKNGRDISINFDMQTFTSLMPRDRISVRRSQHTVTFLHPVGWSYYDTLREKLHWNEIPTFERSPVV
ncbi:NAD kinase [Massilia sp. W12]|uniref:NAD kinase n=1 Tax=Massilia sp. W12 TaxID=3126507 RepID=UPI0030D5BA20